MSDEQSAKAGEPSCADHAEGGSPATPRQRRMSAKRKQEAVLRVLRGEDLELVSREFGITAADLSGWRDSFLEAGAASLSPLRIGRRGRSGGSTSGQSSSRRKGHARARERAETIGRNRIYAI